MSRDSSSESVRRDAAAENNLQSGLAWLQRAQLEAVAEERLAPRFVNPYAALRGVLEDVGAMASLVVQIDRGDPIDEELAKWRRRLVGLALEATTTIAALLGLVFEMEAQPGESKAPAAQRREIDNLEAVVEWKRLLGTQLQCLYRTMRRGEGWRTASAEEIWRTLLHDVADLLPWMPGLSGLSEVEHRKLEIVAADAANQLALLVAAPSRVPAA